MQSQPALRERRCAPARRQSPAGSLNFARRVASRDPRLRPRPRFEWLATRPGVGPLLTDPRKVGDWCWGSGLRRQAEGLLWAGCGVWGRARRGAGAGLDIPPLPGVAGVGALGVLTHSRRAR